MGRWTPQWSEALLIVRSCFCNKKARSLKLSCWLALVNDYSPLVASLSSSAWPTELEELQGSAFNLEGLNTWRERERERDSSGGWEGGEHGFVEGCGGVCHGRHWVHCVVLNSSSTSARLQSPHHSQKPRLVVMHLFFSFFVILCFMFFALLTITNRFLQTEVTHEA